jgi:endo-1,4-beta-xylanase
MIRKTLSVLAVIAMAGSAHAATVIGFEAESGTLGSQFDPALADAAALGGFYITTETNNPVNAPGSDPFTVSYSLDVPAGTYDVYVRARIGNNNANDDSFFWASSFGDADPTVAGDWVIANGLGGENVPVGSSGPFGWSTPRGTITSAGGTVQWEIGAREDGFDIDAFALVPTGQTVTATELDNAVTATEVPEPASLAMGLVGLTLLAGRRRRR